MVDTNPSTERYGSCSPAPKRQKCSKALTPRSFVTWNCNGLLNRCRKDSHEIARLVRETKSPDVILLQEVRCKAKSGGSRGEMCAEDEAIVRSLFGPGGSLHHYEPTFSLDDSKRYSGTCTLTHKRVRRDKNKTSCSIEGATELMLQDYSLNREMTGLATSSPSKKNKASLKAFFVSTKCPPPHKQHHPEGRFQYVRFPHLDLIHTYVPNHGTKQDSFERRREWDEAMLDFFANRKRILAKGGDADRPLLWVGDMNVARDHRDGTHWKFREDGSIYEWWTDESKCFVKKPDSATRQASHMGMPSFTIAERERFNAMISQVSLTDIWRALHLNGTRATESHLSRWDRSEWTWRGHLGNGGNVTRYQGKGQRLDYFLASNISLDDVVSCEILGFGQRREGLFCGSDHCAVELQLRPEE